MTLNRFYAVLAVATGAVAIILGIVSPATIPGIFIGMAFGLAIMGGWYNSLLDDVLASFRKCVDDFGELRDEVNAWK